MSLRLKAFGAFLCRGALLPNLVNDTVQVCRTIDLRAWGLGVRFRV